MSESENTEKLHKAYHSKSATETSAVYDDWAGDYETHMKNVGYTHPAIVAAMFARHMAPGRDPILDAGAGTGVMGEVLTALGYTNLTGLDASAEMLARAETKGKYQQLKNLFLGERLEFPDDHFVGVVSSGVFTQGHAPLSGLDELIRVTKPGGLMVFSISRTYLDGLFQDKREQLDKAGLWRAIDQTELYDSTPHETVHLSQVFAFEVS